MPDNITTQHLFPFRNSVLGSDGSSDTDFGSMSWSDWRIGVKNRRYRQQIAQHENATTNLEGFRRVVHASPGYAKWVNPSWGPSWWMEHFGHASPSMGSHIVPGVFPSDLRYEADVVALNRFVNKAVEAQRAFAGSTFMGELLETLRMIKRPGTALRRGISDYSREAKKRSRKYRKPSDKSKAISGTWLEYSFGWLPLLSDIQQGFDALAQIDMNPTIDVQTGAKALRVESDMVTVVFRTNYLDLQRNTLYKASTRIRGEVWAKPPSFSPGAAASHWGFDPIRDFLPTLWELIPYSFLVDYFTNMGTIVQSACFWRSNIAWFCRTREHLSVRVSNGTGYYRISPEFQRTANTDDRYKVVDRYVKRDVPDSLIPGLSFRLPFGLKWLNIAALANERR